jgi:hypothetical protein
MAKITNTSNNTNIQLKSPSAMGFVEGNAYDDAITTRNCIYASETGITTETSVLSIRNVDTFQGKINKVFIQPDLCSISVKGSNTFLIKAIKNTTLGGTPVWTDINANYSVIQYDTSATTVTNGVLIAAVELDAGGSRDFEIGNMNLFLHPGDMCTFSATSSSNAQVFLSVSWREFW